MVERRRIQNVLSWTGRIMLKQILTLILTEFTIDSVVLTLIDNVVLTLIIGFLDHLILMCLLTRGYDSVARKTLISIPNILYEVKV